MANTSGVVSQQLGQLVQSSGASLQAQAILYIVIGVIIIVAGIFVRGQKNSNKNLRIFILAVGALVLLYGIFTYAVGYRAASVPLS